ncbi:hypothetical protein [Gemmatimonas sp.]|jgi:hypothetical protein|uniref:hypothetical protein n=1 Tax=Gemmatimonas sp. TaxID=1962908 RepID=UPI0037C066FD
MRGATCFSRRRLCCSLVALVTTVGGTACRSVPATDHSLTAAWEARLSPSEEEQTLLLIIRDSTGIATDGLVDIPFVLRPGTRRGSKRVHVGSDSEAVVSLAKNGETLMMEFAGESPRANTLRFGRRSALGADGWPTDTQLVRRRATQAAWRELRAAVAVLLAVQRAADDALDKHDALAERADDLQIRLRAAEASLEPVSGRRLDAEIAVLRDSVMVAVRTTRDLLVSWEALVARRRTGSLQSSPPQPPRDLFLPVEGRLRWIQQRTRQMEQGAPVRTGSRDPRA